MKKKRLIMVFALIIFLLVLGLFLFYSANFSSSDFSVDKILIKSVIKEDERLNQSFSINNLGERDNFKIEMVDLENLVSLDKNDFYLDNGESEEISVSFLGENAVPEVYAGSLIIKTEKKTKTLPIILEVQSLDTYFAIRMDVDSKYKEVIKEEKITVGVNLFNLKDTETRSVDVEYKIITLEGETIFLEKENVAVGSKSAITKTVQIPKNTKTGNYIFASVLNFQNSTSTSSYLFEVSNRLVLSQIINEDVFQISILVLLFTIVSIIIYILSERNKLLLKLKSQQKSELKFYAEKIEKQKQDLLKRAKSEKEKTKINRDYSEARSKILSGIKNEQIKQRNELKKLSKGKETKEVNKRLRKWKKQTYAKALEKAEISQKLKLKLATLKKAFDGGYISKDSYKKGESRLSKKIRK